MSGKIYTKRGDRGETGLLGAGRVSKSAARIDAIGATDEANAALGLALSFMEPSEWRERLALLQPDLFCIGSNLASPVETRGSTFVPSVPLERVAAMEAWIDESDEELPPLDRFIMPGGCPAAAALHVARSAVRRAERAITKVAQSEAVSDATLVYINRLSDLLFAAARVVNHRQGAPETKWVSGA